MRNQEAMTNDTAENTPVLNSQKVSAYQPTRAARKLLEVLLNPEHRFKTKTEQCLLAKISRERYRQLFHNKDFMCHYTRESQKLVKMAQGPMVSALVKSAVRGNPQNLKVGLAMAGMYHDKIGLAVNPDADGNPQPVRFQTDMEIAVKLARILFGNKQVVEYVMARIKNGTNTTDNTGAERPLDRGTDNTSVILDAE